MKLDLASIEGRFLPARSDPFGPDCIFIDCTRSAAVVDTSEDNLRYGRHCPMCFEHALFVAVNGLTADAVQIVEDGATIKVRVLP